MGLWRVELDELHQYYCYHVYQPTSYSSHLLLWTHDRQLPLDCWLLIQCKYQYLSLHYLLIVFRFNLCLNIRKHHANTSQS